MAKRRRIKIAKSQLILLKAFAFGLALILLLAVAGYYRSQAVNQHQQDEAALAKKKALASKWAFIKAIAPIAQREDKPYGLYPSVTIAQACLESDFGQSTLSERYNNLFGVKGSDPNTTKEMTTKEFVNGKWLTTTGRFQIYDSYESAIRAHTALFVNGTTWNAKQYQHVLQAKNWREQAQALQTDGYATDPDYTAKVIALVEEFDLTQYD